MRAKYLDFADILRILNECCDTPHISEEAKERLAILGCRILGYNCREIHF